MIILLGYENKHELFSFHHLISFFCKCTHKVFLFNNNISYCSFFVHKDCLNLLTMQKIESQAQKNCSKAWLFLYLYSQKPIHILRWHIGDGQVVVDDCIQPLLRVFQTSSFQFRRPRLIMAFLHPSRRASRKQATAVPSVRFLFSP